MVDDFDKSPLDGAPHESGGRPARQVAARVRVSSVAAVVVGSVLVAGSGFARWVEVLGSDLTGFRLAELVGDFGDELEGVPPKWVGAAWYLFPASAAVCWLLAFRRSPAAASIGHAIIGSAVALAAGLYLGLADVQPGPLLALVGGGLVAAGGLGAVGLSRLAMPQ